MQAKEFGAGYRVEWKDTLYIVPTPIVAIDEQNRYHSTEIPAIRWKDGKEFYYLSGVNFDKKLWKTVTSPDLTPKQVFAIENTEQRRIAYELMDKLKMKELDNYTVLEDSIDDSGNPQKIVSFNIDGFDKPFIYYNCFCPTTGREYFLQTESTDCVAAKAQSFGLDNVIFEREW
jgi:hypothetical protein